MAQDLLAERLGGLKLSENSAGPQLSRLPNPDGLRFIPKAHRAWIRDKTTLTPRYLFRVVSPDTSGSTDQEWVMSSDAAEGKPTATTDCFARSDKSAVAAELNAHLRWWPARYANNFVSWTTSLLFAVQYGGFRNVDTRTSNSDIDNTYLCIIDTTRYSKPEELFVRDIDLIKAFAPYDLGSNFQKNLSNMLDMREGNTWYFGEYLSQGKLDVRNNLQMVSMRALVDAGIMSLTPEFPELWAKSNSQVNAIWTKAVITKREAFYQGQQQKLNISELSIISKVAELFGEPYMLAVAASFLSLGPRELKYEHLRWITENMTLSSVEKDECSPLTSSIIAPDTMPEVKEFHKTMSILHAHFTICQIGDQLNEVLNALNSIKPKLAKVSQNSHWQSPLFAQQRRNVGYKLKRVSMGVDLVRAQAEGVDGERTESVIEVFGGLVDTRFGQD